MRAYHSPLLVLAICPALALVACGGGGGSRTLGGTGGVTATSGGATATTGATAATGTSSTSGGFDVPPDPNYVGVEIEPADPLIDVLDGQIPAPTAFQAFGITENNDKVPITGTWDFDRFDIATIGQGTGELTATGTAGGVGTVTFTGQGLQGTTTATIKLHVTDDPENVPPGVKGAFDGAIDPDPSLALLYPYNQTVFPRGIRGPVLQWNGGNAGDIYYVHLESDTFEFEGWQTVDPPSRYTIPTVPQDVWLKLTDSVVGDVTLTVQRYDAQAQKAYLGKVQNWTIADANLTGVIYYWEVNNGSVVRIKPGDPGPEQFLTPPAGVTCVACHSVSRDGSTLVASFNGGSSPWGTFDAASGTNLFNSNEPSGFEAISPDGAYVLWRHWAANITDSQALILSTYDSTAQLAVLDPPVGFPAHPTWSPDGTKVALAVRTDGSGLDFTQSTLWLADVDLVTPQFNNLAQIVANDAARPTLTYPTFAPDSQWIAFMRATQARTRGAAGELWLTNLDGSTVLSLDRANGVGVIDAAQQAQNYEPTFMPVSLGGYFWVVFVSERQYGNILTDTNEATRRKQLWVAAIDANPQAGQDPSHPAFWLPGQETDNQNMRGFWSLNPCKELGEGCEAGFDCCGGFCVDDGMGGKVCGDKPEQCSMLGDSCGDAADCCDPMAQCVGGFCSIIPG